MNAMLKDVRALAGEIGPRGTGTTAEAAAADYVTRRLASLGLPAEQHAFRSVPSQNAFPLAVSLLALLAVILYPLGGTVTPWLAALLSVSAFWLLWQTIRSAFNPLLFVLPKVVSRNVETRLPPKGEPRQRVVILAHLDTNRCRLAWQSSTVNRIEPLTWLTLGMLAALGALHLAGALLGGSLWLWLFSLVPAAYALGMVFTLLRDDRTAYCPGAHDNAASVAVALEVASRLCRRRLRSTEIWFVFDGAEETDHAGVLDLLRRHGPDLRDALFIGLEGLGSGEVVYLTRQGLCTHYRPTPDLIALAERLAARHPEMNFRPAQMVAEDDVRPLRGRGYHAICIAGRDPQTGILPHWHRPDDTPETVSPGTLQQAADILHAFLEEVDRRK